MATRNGFGRVAGPDWPEVYLIGGGPSLRGFDLSLLRGRTCVAINDAILHAPWAAALFSLDQVWIANRKAEIEAFAGERYLAVPDDYDFDHGPVGVTFLRRCRGMTGLSTDPEKLYLGGGNSGFGALNLAFLKRARRIILLGYDYCYGRQHWHQGYKWANNGGDRVLEGWARQFDHTAPQLTARHVLVLNASPDSRITVFPTIPLSSLPLEEWRC